MDFRPHLFGPGAASSGPPLLEQAFRLRYEVFVRQLKWTLPRAADGVERDEFDDDNAHYVLVTHGIDDVILAGLRFHPTSSPTLLTSVFPFLMDTPVPSTPAIWEGTRLFTNPALAAEESRLAMAALLHEAFAYARRHGVDHIVSVSDVFLERVLRRTGLTVERLGQVRQIDNGIRALALRMPCTDEVIERLEAMRGVLAARSLGKAA